MTKRKRGEGNPYYFEQFSAIDFSIYVSMQEAWKRCLHPCLQYTLQSPTLIPSSQIKQSSSSFLSSSRDVLPSSCCITLLVGLPFTSIGDGWVVNPASSIAINAVKRSSLLRMLISTRNGFVHQIDTLGRR